MNRSPLKGREVGGLDTRRGREPIDLGVALDPFARAPRDCAGVRNTHLRRIG
jgi:hypothetical protein